MTLKILASAAALALLAGTPAFADQMKGTADTNASASGPVSDQAVKRTGSKATEGAATGAPVRSTPDVIKPTPPGMNTTAAGASEANPPVQAPTTGADPYRTGSKAAAGSATGSQMGERTGANTAPAAVGQNPDATPPVQAPTTGADPYRTGSKAVPGSATGSQIGTTK